MTTEVGSGFAQDTACFMNTMTVCGMGITIDIDSSMDKSIKEIYSGEGAKGKLSQKIISEMKDIIMKNPNNTKDLVEAYLKCVADILPKQGCS
jgi:hypothetical protein